MLTKEIIHSTIESLPDNYTIEQVIEEMILLNKIDQGLTDVQEGRIFTQHQANKKLNKWLM